MRTRTPVARIEPMAAVLAAPTLAIAGSGEREDWSLHAPRSAHASPCAEYTVTHQLELPLHIKRGAYFTAVVHHRHGRRSRLVRGWIPREPREPLLERLVRNPRGRRRGELALLRAALRGEPPHLRRGDAQGERPGQGAKTRRAVAPRCRPKAAPCSRRRRRGPTRAATARRAARPAAVHASRPRTACLVRARVGLG